MKKLATLLFIFLSLIFGQSLADESLGSTPAPGGHHALELVSRYATTFTEPSKLVPSAIRVSSQATDAPLMGNGDLGVCISGPPEEQVFWVAKNDFWHLKNGSYRTFQPNFGVLHIDIPALAGAGYALRQSLADAKTVARFTVAGSSITQTSFVAATANVLAVKLEAAGKPVEAEVSFHPSSTHLAPLEEQLTGEENGCRWATRAFARDVGMPTRATVAWRMLGTAATKFTLQPGEPITLLLSMASNFDADDTQGRALAILENANVAILEKAHDAWWRDFYERSFVDIPDADIMRRYYISQYIMASASRNPRFPPAIIGAWATAETGWCAYWMNYNHAAPYYGLYSSNHIEQADPQDAPILDFRPVGSKYAAEILKCHGVLYPVGIGPLGFNVCDAGMSDTTNREFEKGITTWGQRSNAAYNLVNMGQRWYATYDLDYGRKIYPYTKAVADFWEDYLVLEGDGKGGQRYVINDDSVHEGSGKNKNPAPSLALVRNTLKLMLDLSEELGQDAGHRAKWNDVLARLSDFPTKKWGQEQKPIFILAETQVLLWGGNTVHIQHIYPGGAIGLDSSPELLATARNTIALTQRWHDANGANSFFPAAARVGYDPQAILRELHRYCTEGMSPNGFSKGNPHGIENCSTVPNTINEMLLQSHEGVLRFFPVWPKTMNARFGTLRARGAFLVSAELNGGYVRDVKIISGKGRDCIVQNPWPGKGVRVVRNGKSSEGAAGDRFTLHTTVNETIELQTADGIGAHRLGILTAQAQN